MELQGLGPGTYFRQKVPSAWVYNCRKNKFPSIAACSAGLAPTRMGPLSSGWSVHLAGQASGNCSKETEMRTNQTGPEANNSSPSLFNFKDLASGNPSDKVCLQHNTRQPQTLPGRYWMSPSGPLRCAVRHEFVSRLSATLSEALDGQWMFSNHFSTHRVLSVSRF